MRVQECVCVDRERKREGMSALEEEERERGGTVVGA